MAIVSLATILGWFKTGDKPTQAQFANTWDSFRHKLESIPVGDIDGLTALLTDFASELALNAHINNDNGHGVNDKVAALQGQINSLISDLGNKENSFAKNTAFNLATADQTQEEQALIATVLSTPKGRGQWWEYIKIKAESIAGIFRFTNGLEAKLLKVIDGSTYKTALDSVVSGVMRLGNGFNSIRFDKPIANWINPNTSATILEVNPDGTSQPGAVLMPLTITNINIIYMLIEEINWNTSNVFIGDLSAYIDSIEQGMYYFDDVTNIRYDVQENDIITRTFLSSTITRSNEISFTNVSGELKEIGRIKLTASAAGVITVFMKKTSGAGGKAVGSIETAMFYFAANPVADWKYKTPLSSSIAEDSSGGSGVDIFDLSIDSGELIFYAQNGGNRYKSDFWKYQIKITNPNTI